MSNVRPLRCEVPTLWSLRERLMAASWEPIGMVSDAETDRKQWHPEHN